MLYKVFRTWILVCSVSCSLLLAEFDILEQLSLLVNWNSRCRTYHFDGLMFPVGISSYVEWPSLHCIWHWSVEGVEPRPRYSPGLCEQSGILKDSIIKVNIGYRNIDEVLKLLKKKWINWTPLCRNKGQECKEPWLNPLQPTSLTPTSPSPHLLLLHPPPPRPYDIVGVVMFVVGIYRINGTVTVPCIIYSPSLLLMY